MIIQQRSVKIGRPKKLGYNMYRSLEDLIKYPANAIAPPGLISPTGPNRKSVYMAMVGNGYADLKRLPSGALKLTPTPLGRWEYKNAQVSQPPKRIAAKKAR